jgi:hypothetical protein
MLAVQRRHALDGCCIPVAVCHVGHPCVVAEHVKVVELWQLFELGVAPLLPGCVSRLFRAAAGDGGADVVPRVAPLD